MANEKEGLSTAESLRKTRTYGQVRCHNPSCMGRLDPKPGEPTVKCPKCGMEWRVFWVKSGFPRIRGPVWDVNKRLADETFEKKMKEKGEKMKEEKMKEEKMKEEKMKEKEEKKNGPK